MALSDAQQWLDPAKGEFSQEFISPQDVKNAFEQVYRDVGILDADLDAAAVGKAKPTYVLTLRSTDHEDASKDKPGEKTPDGILGLQSLEDLLKALPKDGPEIPVPTAADKGKVLAVISDGTVTEFTLVNPSKLLLTQDQIDKITEEAKKAVMAELMAEMKVIKDAIIEALQKTPPTTT